MNSSLPAVRRPSRASRGALVISLVVHGALGLAFGVVLALRSEISEIADALDVVWIMAPEPPARIKRRLKVPVQPTRLDREEPIALRDPNKLMEQARNRLTEVMRRSERIPVEDVSNVRAPEIERLPDVTTAADVHLADNAVSLTRSRPGQTDGQGDVTGRTRVRGSGLGSLLYGNEGTEGLLGGGGRPGVHDPLNIIDFLRGRGSSGRIVYLLDVSSSMSAAGLHKLDLAKKSLLDHLYLLTDDSEFNVLTFSSRVSRLWREPRPVNIESRADASDHLGAFTQESIMGNQGTDTLGALQAALKMQPDVVVLLTDGLPTSGGGRFVEYDPELIGQSVREQNTSNAALYIIGLEIDGLGGPGELLLKRLAQQTGGEVKFVTRDELRRFAVENRPAREN